MQISVAVKVKRQKKPKHSTKFWVKSLRIYKKLDRFVLDLVSTMTRSTWARLAGALYGVDREWRRRGKGCSVVMWKLRMKL